MKGLRVALVVPSTFKQEETPTRRSLKLTGICAPLNLAALASYIRMKKPYVVLKIIDGVLGIDVTDELFKFQPNIIGVTACTPQAPNAYALGDMLQKNRPDILTVMGGVHASALPNEAIEHFNCVVVGEGELAFTKIIDDFEHGKRTVGIIFGEPLTNLDDTPMPAYDLLDMGKYLENSSVPTLKAPILLLVTTRGCLYDCPFCHNSNRKYPPRWFSAERVVEELEYLLVHYKPKSFWFTDDEFLILQERLKEIGKLMKERNLKIEWGCQARVNTMTLETLQLAKSMGCKLIMPGFESMAPRILKYLKCGTTTVEANEHALKVAKEVGITVGGNFIFGTPTETIGEMNETFAWIQRSGSLKFANFNTLIPFPETSVDKLCRRRGWLPKVVDYTRFVMTNRVTSTYIVDKAVSLKEFNRFLIHAQRVAWVLFRLRLGTRFRQLLNDLHFWYVLFYHPCKMLKMLQCKVAHQPIIC
jgi:anaerobic magnesium-protoporphyrin IX monomethyl ester cyclase